MNVIRSDVLGFCMGVRRAVEIARAAAAEPAATPVFTLGPLIHNPRVLDELKGRGIMILDEIPAELRGATVLIRAHGIAPDIEQTLREKAGRVIDATCPTVKKSQLIAQQFENAGVRLFIAGEAGHAEIAGLTGYAPFCIVAGNAAEAEIAAQKLRETEPNAKTALIAQTTIAQEEFISIGNAIKKYFPGLEIVRTICPATKERQDSLRKLACIVDALVIAGGRESANTRRLAAIAGELPCVLAESAADIPSAFAAFKTVGLCAGASTPDSVISEIEEHLMELQWE